MRSMDRELHYLITVLALLSLALILISPRLAFNVRPDLIQDLEYQMNYLDVQLKPR